MSCTDRTISVVSLMHSTLMTIDQTERHCMIWMFIILWLLNLDSAIVIGTMGNIRLIQSLLRFPMARWPLFGPAPVGCWVSQLVDLDHSTGNEKCLKPCSSSGAPFTYKRLIHHPSPSSINSARSKWLARSHHFIHSRIELRAQDTACDEHCAVIAHTH